MLSHTCNPSTVWVTQSDHLQKQVGRDNLKLHCKVSKSMPNPWSTTPGVDLWTNKGVKRPALTPPNTFVRQDRAKESREMHFVKKQKSELFSIAYNSSQYIIPKRATTTSLWNTRAHMCSLVQLKISLKIAIWATDTLPFGLAILIFLCKKMTTQLA